MQSSKVFWFIAIIKEKTAKRWPKKLIKQYDAVAKYENVGAYPSIFSK